MSRLRAEVAAEAGQWQAATTHLQAALVAATAWEQEQPNRLQPRRTRCRVLRDLGHAQNHAGDFGASVASFRQAIAIGEALAERFPKDPGRTEELIAVLEAFAWTLFDRFRQSVLAEAAACIDRAVSLDSTAGPVPSEGCWRRLGLQASIADAHAAGGGDRYWPGVEAALPAELPVGARAQDDLLGIYAGLARWHLDHGRSAPAAATLEKAGALIARAPKHLVKRTVEVAWLTARLAADSADHAACAGAADRVLAARSTWYGRRRAADCLHLGWRSTAK